MIDYETLTQDALRGIVRAVLSRAAKSGLPGDHHFYISFHTQAPGVTLSKRLREKYPREMTIVLQHRFWDLTVTEDRFDVKLTFDGIPERIIVPFAAVKVFFDPSVRYGMQFEEPDGDAETESGLGEPMNFDRELSDFEEPESAAGPAPARTPTVRSAVPRRPRVVKKPRNDKEPDAPRASIPSELGGLDHARRPREPDDARNGGHASANSPPPPSKTVEGGAEIVRLDAFRKK